MLVTVLSVLLIAVGLAAMVGARASARRAIAQEERFFGDRLTEGQRQRRMILGQGLNIVVGGALVVFGGLSLLGVVDLGQNTPETRGDEDQASVLPYIFLAVWIAAGLFVATMFLLRSRRSRRQRGGRP